MSINLIQSEKSNLANSGVLCQEFPVLARTKGWPISLSGKESYILKRRWSLLKVKTRGIIAVDKHL